MDSVVKKKPDLDFKRGRPIGGTGSSFEKSIIDRICHYRRLYPKWGAQTILTEMVEKDTYNLSDLPSCKTVERYLKSLSLINALRYSSRIIHHYLPPSVFYLSKTPSSNSFSL